MFELAAKSIDWLLLNYWQLFENYDWIIDSQILTFAKSENILIFQLNSNILNILSYGMFQSACVRSRDLAARCVMTMNSARVKPT